MTTSRPTYKQPAVASKGMVTSNHPLASLAGNEVLMRGGNAVDAAIATMFALTVVEPMMVTIFGAGFVNIRWANGECATIDNYATVPGAATPDMFRPVPGTLDHLVEGDENAVGHRSVAVGGTLLGWATAIEKYGRLSLAEVIRPAVRFAREGFQATPYLCSIIESQADDIRRFPDTEKVFMPRGGVPEPGDTIVRTEYADTLDAIGREGPGYLYGGPLGQAIADDMAGERRAHHHGRHPRLPYLRAAAGSRRCTAATRSSQWRRPPPEAPTSSRCSRSSRASTSPAWASAPPMRSTSPPRR
ncbi:MAG: gamma-glutamyltransferase [Dehalococcoidia bacterium]|nr:gamma-glutamyltransferase [Dehalococcoidia bacterium]